MGLTIALVDDHILIRNALSDLLRRNNYTVVCEADNGKVFFDYLETNPLPDIILLDINMPVMDGYSTMEEISRKYKEHKVIALSMYDSEQSIFRMINAGAKGYLLKESQPKELIAAIESVNTLGIYYSEIVNSKLIKGLASIVDKDQKKNNVLEFTPKEIEILHQFCTEMSYKEIATKLSLSVRTIEGYRDGLFDKTGINTRVGLVIYAIKTGVVRL